MGRFLGAYCLTKVPDDHDAFSELTKDFDGTFLDAEDEPHEWWKALNDPELDQAIEPVLGSILDLAGAGGWAKQARAKGRITNAARFSAVLRCFAAQESEPQAIAIQRTHSRPS